MYRTVASLPYLISLLLAFALIAACSGEDPDAHLDNAIDNGTTNSDSNADSNSDADSDSDSDVDADADGDGDARLPVAIDLDATFDSPGEGHVAVYQAQEEAELIGGEIAQGKIGDWILENRQGRYLIGLGDRAIGPCAWDGNPLEVESVVNGQRQGSVLGQICFLLNVAQTFKPESVEVLEDGSNGRAILAITGHTVPLDFLNLSAMLEGFAPGILDNLDLDPDRPLPFTITVYYALTPESPALRVLTAVRNDGEAREHFIGAHLVLSGSTGSYFTPLGRRRGWGYSSLGADGLDADPVSYLGYFSRHSGYAVVPDPAEHLSQFSLPVGAGMLAVSGAVGLLYGATDLLPLITARKSQWDQTAGFIGIDPGEHATLGYHLYPGTGSLTSVTGNIYDQFELETHRLEGVVVDHLGEPKEGVKVTYLRDGDRAYTAGWSDFDGRFAADLPAGSWEVRFRDDQVPTVIEAIDLQEDLDLGTTELNEPARVTFRVTRPDGQAMPARIVIECDDDCGLRSPDSRELDSDFRAPLGWMRILELGPEGTETILMPPGFYRISANRGMTHSIWPDDATTNGGALFQFLPGDDEVIDIELARVVDTSGTLSADFHIHAMASPDSQVSNRARVLDFLAGGLDVMVSSDHDGVSDFAPTIAALNAQNLITSLVGNEITSSNLGHINVFPLELDENARRGGPLDWTRQGTYHLNLQELVDATREHPGEQVIQLNHPRLPMGAIGNLKVDVLTGQSFAEPESLRMSPAYIDPVSGDTGLWSEEFDALEVYNGLGMGNFWSTFRWWLAMIGRGFSPAGTAVSDTHGIYGSLGATPRSFILVDANEDTPETLNVDNFIAQIRRGALFGTNGPFLRMHARNESGERIGLADTLDASSGPITLEILIERPDWIDVDTLDLFVNLDAETLVPGAPGEAINDAVTATLRIPISWDEDLHRELVASGTRNHYRWRQTVEVPISLDTDSYVVAMVRGLSGRPMRPVVSSTARPMAFTNPLFFDVDGGGYDNPPLSAARQARLEMYRNLGQARQTLSSNSIIIAPGDELTATNLARLFEALSCTHGNAKNADEDHHHGPLHPLTHSSNRPSHSHGSGHPHHH